jgi:hypothetical protein
MEEYFHSFQKRRGNRQGLWLGSGDVSPLASTNIFFCIGDRKWKVNACVSDKLAQLIPIIALERWTVRQMPLAISTRVDRF